MYARITHKGGETKPQMMPAMAWPAPRTSGFFSALRRPNTPRMKPIGPKMKEVDAALAEQKLAFPRSEVDFGNLPTGVDNTPLKGEYSYKNNESMMSLNVLEQAARALRPQAGEKDLSCRRSKRTLRFSSSASRAT